MQKSREYFALTANLAAFLSPKKNKRNPLTISTCSVSHQPPNMLLTFFVQTKKAMDTISTKPIRFVFFIFFTCIFLDSLIQQSLAAQLCSTSTCRPSDPIIRFPFRLQNLQPTSCAFPGFDLFCDAFNRTLVQLPNSGRFTVNAIDYAAQNIWINDPEYCLSKRILHLNLTGSPFNGVFSQEFTFFNCTVDSGKYKFDPIRCLSGDNYSVFASSSERATAFFASKCEWVATVAVPVEWDFFAPLDTSILSDDIRLTWGWPRCRRCESRGGRCGFRAQNTTQIGCTNADRHGLPRSARYAIVVGAGVPAFLCLLGFVYFLCRQLKRHGRRRHPIMDFSIVVLPQAITTVSGLDGPTIESYPKTILGESCRLPNPDDTTCSICLSEYMPKDTLRSIPECEHCFHAQCIDEWLRLNPSCPVCRNSPDSKPPTQAAS